VKPQRFARQGSAIARFGAVAACVLGLVGCASLPQADLKRFEWPRDVYLGSPPAEREYEVLGQVRTKVDYPTLTAEHDDRKLCKNYFNKAAQDLLKRAQKAGGNGVVDVKSVVFLANGRTETYPRAECVDEGDEGQVAATGIAVRWKPLIKKD